MGEERRVSDWYNSLSSSYFELYGEEQSLKHKLVTKLLAGDRFAVLVDIGCGPGTLLKDLRGSYDYGVGIDLSKDMLRAAKKRRSDKTDLVLATFRALPIKEGTVDCIVSISTITADSKLPRILDELTRISRKSAIIAFTLLHRSKSGAPPLPSNVQRTSRISNRETAYYLRLNG